LESIENKEKIYYIYNNEKEDINEKIKKVFEIYLKDCIKTEEELENNP